MFRPLFPVSLSGSSGNPGTTTYVAVARMQYTVNASSPPGGVGKGKFLGRAGTLWAVLVKGIEVQSQVEVLTIYRQTCVHVHYVWICAVVCVCVCVWGGGGGGGGDVGSKLMLISGPPLEGLFYKSIG